MPTTAGKKYTVSYDLDLVNSSGINTKAVNSGTLILQKPETVSGRQSITFTATGVVSTIQCVRSKAKDGSGSVEVFTLDNVTTSAESTENTFASTIFVADVLTYSDYYPFGMLVPTRHGSSDRYRYGFNGKELDNELKGEGNSYDFGARMLDVRIGRWFATDPKEDKFPNMSPYVAFNNNPILYDDPTGESGEITINKKTKTVTVTSIYVFYGSQSSPKLAKQYAKRIQDDYNKANGKVKIGGKVYSVKFRVVGVDISKFGEVAAYNLIDRNKDIRKNFIRLEKETDFPYTKASYTDGGGNTGYWSTNQINENELTTVSHEHNHSLGGLNHPEKIDPDGGKSDQENSIDMTVHSYNFVNKKFVKKDESGQYTVDVTKRKVTQKDIDAYFSDDVKKELETKGKADAGQLKNEYHGE